MFEPMHFLISSSVPPSAQTSPARSLSDYRVASGAGVSSGGYVTSVHGSIAGGSNNNSNNNNPHYLGGPPSNFPNTLAGSGSGNGNSSGSNNNNSNSSGGGGSTTTQIAASKIPNHPNNQRDGARVVSSDIRADGHRRKGGKTVNG